MPSHPLSLRTISVNSPGKNSSLIVLPRILPPFMNSPRGSPSPPPTPSNPQPSLSIYPLSTCRRSTRGSYPMSIFSSPFPPPMQTFSASLSPEMIRTTSYQLDWRSFCWHMARGVLKAAASTRAMQRVPSPSIRLRTNITSRGIFFDYHVSSRHTTCTSSSASASSPSALQFHLELGIIVIVSLILTICIFYVHIFLHTYCNIATLTLLVNYILCLHESRDYELVRC